MDPKPRATITVDTLAQSFFLTGERRRTNAGLLAKLGKKLRGAQQHLDVYERVVFAGYGQDRYVTITPSNVSFEGVFPVCLEVRQPYEARHNDFSGIQKETLVVAAHEGVAEDWHTTLETLGYDVQRLDLPRDSNGS